MNTNNEIKNQLSDQVARFLNSGGNVTVVPFGAGAQSPAAMSEQENRAAINKSTGKCFVPGVFNPHSAASKKAYSRGGKA